MAGSAPTLWFISPLYHDIEAYQELHRQLSEIVRTRITPGIISAAQFLVVDDSAGEDPEIAKLQSLPGVTVYTPPHHLGHQRGLVFALRRLAPQLDPDDFVVSLDSDGEDRPVDVPTMIEALVAGEREVPGDLLVLAKRTSRQTPLSFNLLYLGFRLLFLILTGRVIETGNFACLRARLLRRIIQHPSFDQCYSSSLVALRLRRKFVPCPRGARFQGQSRMRTSDLMVHGYRMLMPFIDRIAIRALAFISILFGGVFAVLGAFVARAFMTGTELSPFFWLFLCFVAGFFILFFANFIVLFTVFSQSQAISLQGIEERCKETRA